MRSEGIFARKQAANEITDLNRGKRRQELQCDNERTTATPIPALAGVFYAEAIAATRAPLRIVGLMLGRSSKAYAKISRASFEIVPAYGRFSTL